MKARIGELLPSIEEAMSMGQQVRYGKLPGTRPEGVTGHQATAARTIARHPEIVEEVIRQALGNRASLRPEAVRGVDGEDAEGGRAFVSRGTTPQERGA